MALPKMNPDVRDWLVRTLVWLSNVDGRVVPVEGALVEGVMKRYDTPEAQRAEVRRQLRKLAPIPEPGKPPASMSYDDKLTAFSDIVELVFADGVLHPAEEAAVMKLATTFSLHPGDMQPIWDRAKRHWDGTRELPDP